MTREEWIARVEQLARERADAAGIVWPSQIRLHDRVGPGGTHRYAVSVHADPDPAQRTLILWVGHSTSEHVQGVPIAETVWQQIAGGAEALGWRVHGVVSEREAIAAWIDRRAAGCSPPCECGAADSGDEHSVCRCPGPVAAGALRVAAERIRRGEASQ